MPLTSLTLDVPVLFPVLDIAPLLLFVVFPLALTLLVFLLLLVLPVLLLVPKNVLPNLENADDTFRPNFCNLARFNFSNLRLFVSSKNAKTK